MCVWRYTPPIEESKFLFVFCFLFFLVHERRRKVCGGRAEKEEEKNKDGRTWTVHTGWGDRRATPIDLYRAKRYVQVNVRIVLVTISTSPHLRP